MVDFIVTVQGASSSGLPQSTLDRLENEILIAARTWGQYFDAADDTVFEFVLELNYSSASGAQARHGGLDLAAQSDSGQLIYQTNAITELLTGQDTNGALADYTVFLDPSTIGDFWGFDSDPITRTGDVPSGTLDFQSLFLHEMGHAFGIWRLAYGVDGDGLQNAAEITTFEQHIKNINGVPFFTGTNASDVFGGPVPIPNFSEFYTDHIGNTGSLANAALMNGVALWPGQRYFISPLDIAVLADAGVPIKSASKGNDELFGFESIAAAEFNNVNLQRNFGEILPIFLGADNLEGGEGDDTLWGLSGNDTLRGGLGNDHLMAGTGADFISGGQGDDVAFAGGGHDQVFAGPGDIGSDIFAGGSGDDTLGGGVGDDLLIGDMLISEYFQSRPGDDGFEAGNGRDVIFGGAGNDTLIGGSLSETVMENGLYDAGEAVLSEASANTLYAGTGNDLLFGAAGDDILGGGAGNDTIVGADGNDLIFGGRSTNDNGDLVNDSISGGAGDDTVYAGDGHDDISGGEGSDLLFNGSGKDTVYGDAGEDTLYGGGGEDVLTGGAGSDTFVLAATNGFDIVSDFEVGLDTLDLSGSITHFADIASVTNASVASEHNGEAGLMINMGGDDRVFLTGLTLDSLSEMDIIFS